MPIVNRGTGLGVVKPSPGSVAKEALDNFLAASKAKEEQRQKDIKAWEERNKALINRVPPAAGTVIEPKVLYKIYLEANKKKPGEFQAYVRIVVAGEYPEDLYYHPTRENKGLILFFNRPSLVSIRAYEPVETDYAIDGYETFVEGGLKIRITSYNNAKTSGTADLVLE